MIKEDKIIFDRSTEKKLSNRLFIVIDLTDKKKKVIRLNVPAAYRLGLHEGRRVKFVKIGDDWYVGSTNSEDGYKARKTQAGAYHISSTIVIESMIGPITHLNKGLKYHLKQSTAELDGVPLLFIDRSIRLSINKKTG